MGALFVAIGVCGIASILFYNRTVVLHRAVAAQTQALQALQVKNAELKNSLYTVLDSRNLMAAASRRGLIKEANPSYLTVTASADGGRSAAVAVGE